MTSANDIRIDAARMLRDLAGYVPAGTSLKAIWRKLAKDLDLTVGQITRLWYELWVTVPAWVYLAIRSAWDTKNRVDAALAARIDVRAQGFVERRAAVESRRVGDASARSARL